MDYIESIAKQAQQLTMYDIKSYYNQAKNAVLNVSEMEAKVREATNDDPWGASSTLMQQIADGTHNFQNFNEIMPCIYARFMEEPTGILADPSRKEAREWRQIYKALTLLEFLVKNGSERVVDDARAHVSTIKMLRSFHYVDEKGKDQGINVRNRAQEIAALLMDVEKIRQERRKARANKNKYQGQGNDAAGGLSFTTGGGGRYGGFGSESLGGASAGGGGSGGFDDYPGRAVRSSRDRESMHREQTRERERDSRQPQEGEYDEYEGADDFDHNGPPRRKSPAISGAGAGARGGSRPQPPPKAKKEEKKKEVDLFDFGDDEPVSAPAAAGGSNGGAANMMGGDDDFDDFQTAPPTASAPAPSAAARPANANIFDLLNATSSAPAPAPSNVQSFSQPPAYVPQTNSSNFGMMAPSSATARPNYTPAAPAAPAAKPKAAASTFDDLWTSSLSTVSTSAATTGGEAQGKKSLNEMEQQKAVDKLWGMGAGGGSGTGGGAKPGGGGGDLDDLLL